MSECYEDCGCPEATARRKREAETFTKQQREDARISRLPRGGRRAARRGENITTMLARLARTS